jgi:hypothetical protein
VAKVYIVSFRTHDDRRPSKFIVLADNMKSAINKAWKVKHGRFDLDCNSNRVHRGLEMDCSEHAGFLGLLLETFGVVEHGGVDFQFAV